MRPPSLQESYCDFFSGDPAIIAVPEKVEDLDERTRKLAVARETGHWDDITVPGKQPAKFVMKPLSGNVYREIMDALEGRQIRSSKARQIAFRAAIQNVIDPEIGDVPLKREETERYGSLASVKTSDFFDSIDLSIVTELGGEAIRRASDLSPK